MDEPFADLDINPLAKAVLTHYLVGPSAVPGNPTREELLRGIEGVIFKLPKHVIPSACDDLLVAAKALESMMRHGAAAEIAATVERALKRRTAKEVAALEPRPPTPVPVPQKTPRRAPLAEMDLKQLHRLSAMVDSLSHR
jgi:hypothetical protein